MIFALDLEGCLAPEIWPILGLHYGLPDFRLTTRDIGDFDELMRRRVATAHKAGLRLADIQKLAHAVEPYLGAREFIARLRAMGNVVIISDTFHEFSDPLAAKLGGVNLFANRFELDGAGVINGFKLRIRGQKERIVSGFKSAGFKVAAMGDSMNDFSLLKSCDFPVLFRAVDALKREFPNAASTDNLDEALALFAAAHARFEANGEV